MVPARDAAPTFASIDCYIICVSGCDLPLWYQGCTLKAKEHLWGTQKIVEAVWKTINEGNTIPWVGTATGTWLTRTTECIAIFNSFMAAMITKQPILIGRNGMYLHPAPEHSVLQFEWHIRWRATSKEIHRCRWFKKLSLPWLHL
jgi:hypothetical protein